MHKINKIIKIGVFIAVILIPVFMFAQTSTTSNMNLLSTKVDLLESINSQTLNAIYWFIGTLGALFAGVIGLNIYSNYKINLEKYNQLRKEIEEKLDSRFTEANKKIVALTEEKTKALNSTIETRINSKIQPLGEKLEELFRESLVTQIERHEKKGQVGSIIVLGELLEFDIKKGWDWRTHDTLQEIEKYVDRAALSKDIAFDLQKILNKLPTDYSKQKSNIEGKIKIAA